MLITLEFLVSKDACEDERDIFAKEWPEGVLLTRKSLQRATELSLNLDWLAGAVLPPGQLKTYKDADAPLWKTYKDACDPLLKTYRDARDLLLKTYEDAKAVALADALNLPLTGD